MNAEQAKKAVNRIFRDLNDIAFVEAGAVVLGAILLIIAIERILPILARRSPTRLRMYFLVAIPISRLIILAGTFFWIVPLFINVTFQNFFIIAGGASVALGFAFKDYVSSLIAGIVAVFERPYRTGDWIKVGDVYGEVVGLDSRVVRINTPSDDVVYIPHDLIWTSSVINSNDGAPTLMCVTDFYLHPDHDAAAVRSALEDVALTSAYLEYDKPVLVTLSQSPYATHYQLKAYPFDSRDQFQFISDLTIRGKAAIADLGAAETAIPPLPAAHHSSRPTLDGQG